MKKATIYDYARMCKFYNDCGICPLGAQNCMWLISNCPDKANEIIFNWCREHPIKTRQSEIQKTIPNLILTDVGCCNVCPAHIDGDFYTERVCDNYIDCEKCKKNIGLRR